MWKAYTKFAAGPLALAVGTIVFASTVIIGWRKGVAPVIKRRKRDQNEEFANYVFQEREKKVAESASMN